MPMRAAIIGPSATRPSLPSGGIRGGQVIGESDKTRAVPRLPRAVTPADIHATVFSALGYDAWSITYQTADGRPTALFGRKSDQ